MTTIKDIARITGVSPTTVSNVIHGRSSRVSEETIQKINQAIKQLEYVPNMSARSLVSNSSKVVAFVNHIVTGEGCYFTEDPFHSIFLGILENILNQNGYYLMIRTVASSEDLVSFLQNWNVDGLFFTGIFKDSFFDSVHKLNIPTVLVDSYVHDPMICNVGLEDFKGSYNATKYLIDHGHTSIAFSSPEIRDGGVLHERFLGYKAALADAGISFHKDYIFQHEMDYDSCMEVAKELIAHEEITGLVVTADIMAARIMACLNRLNRKIPEDISVIGFDDINICQITNPPLTTIHQDMYKKGLVAAKFMIGLLNNEKPEQTEVTLPTTLVERDSVKSLK